MIATPAMSAPFARTRHLLLVTFALSALAQACAKGGKGDLVLRVNTAGQIRPDAAVRGRAEVAGTLAHVL